MKVIFLDIDGVLNSEIFYREREIKRNAEGKRESEDREDYHLEQIDARPIQFLNSLIEETGAKVVISSTWRMGNTMPYLQNLLDKKGFKGEIIAFTPILKYEGALRGNEIYLWIQQNAEMLCGSRIGADFKEYVIFDDDSDMLWWQRNNYIKVDAYCGLTPNQCYQAKYILCRDMTFSKALNLPEDEPTTAN